MSVRCTELHSRGYEQREVLGPSAGTVETGALLLFLMRPLETTLPRLLCDSPCSWASLCLGSLASEHWLCGNIAVSPQNTMYVGSQSRATSGHQVCGIIVLCNLSTPSRWDYSPVPPDLTSRFCCIVFSRWFTLKCFIILLLCIINLCHLEVWYIFTIYQWLFW